MRCSSRSRWRAACPSSRRPAEGTPHPGPQPRGIINHTQRTWYEEDPPEGPFPWGSPRWGRADQPTQAPGGAAEPSRSRRRFPGVRPSGLTGGSTRRYRRAGGVHRIASPTEGQSPEARRTPPLFEPREPKPRPCPRGPRQFRRRSDGSWSADQPTPNGGFPTSTVPSGGPS